MLKLLLPALLVAGLGSQANAQMVDIPIWSNGILGQQALRSTYDNYDRQNGIKKDSARPSPACSPEALPAADRRRMEAEYARRQRSDGKASADAWVQEQGRLFRMKLIADGVCAPPPEAATKSAEASTPRGKRPMLNKQGEPCTSTRLEQRVTPGFGGNAMSMGMVPVCAD